MKKSIETLFLGLPKVLSVSANKEICPYWQIPYLPISIQLLADTVSANKHFVIVLPNRLSCGYVVISYKLWICRRCIKSVDHNYLD